MIYLKPILIQRRLHQILFAFIFQLKCSFQNKKKEKKSSKKKKGLNLKAIITGIRNTIVSILKIIDE